MNRLEAIRKAVSRLAGSVKPGMIDFKNRTVRFHFFEKPINRTLISILWYVGEKYGAVITSAFRRGDKGVHGCDPLRGLDIRSKEYTDPMAICDDINARWVYDQGRPWLKVAIYHDVGRGKHIHLQVHENTKRKET